MNRVIYPNRSFIWILVAVIVSDFLVWASVERFAIEQESLNQSLILSFQRSRRPSWKNYVSTADGYSLRYPGHYVATKSKDPHQMCFQGAQNGNDIGFCVTAKENADELSAAAWWDKNGNDKKYSKAENVSVAGSQGLMLSPVEESFGSLMLVVAHDSKVYLLEGNVPSGTIQSLTLKK